MKLKFTGANALSSAQDYLINVEVGLERNRLAEAEISVLNPY